MVVGRHFATLVGVQVYQLGYMHQNQLIRQIQSRLPISVPKTSTGSLFEQQGHQLSIIFAARCALGVPSPMESKTASTDSGVSSTLWLAEWPNEAFTTNDQSLSPSELI